jgi:protein SCO1/2
MKLIFLMILLSSLLLGCRHQNKMAVAQSGLPVYNTADFTPTWPDDPAKATTLHHSIPAFVFTDQNGETITEKTFANKIYVADFFYTSCPGICKKLSANLTEVQEAFEKDSEVLILSHSVTPDFDTQDRLKVYANGLGAINHKWFMVRGNKDSIYSIARKAYFADEDLGLQKSSSDFLHTENILLIDKQRRIRGIYKGTSRLQIADLIKDIQALKKEG